MSTFLQRAAFVGVASVGSMLAEGSFDPVLNDGVVAYIHPESTGVKYAGAAVTAGGGRMSMRQSLFAIDVAHIDLVTSSTKHGVVGVTADAEVISGASMTIEAESATEVNALSEVIPSTDIYAEVNVIEGQSLVVTASGVTGDGAGLIISMGDCVDADTNVEHISNTSTVGTAEIDSAAKTNLDASVDAVVSNATSLSVSGITADGAGVSLTTGTVETAPESEAFALGDVTVSGEVDATSRKLTYVLSDIEVNAGSLGASGVTGDGAALILDNLTNIEASCDVLNLGYGDIVCEATVETQVDHTANVTLPTITGSGDINGAGGATGDGAGMLVSDVTDIEVAPTLITTGEVWVTVPAPVEAGEAAPTTDHSGDADIDGFETTITAPGIVGHGVALHLTSGEVETTPTSTLSTISETTATAESVVIARTLIGTSLPDITGVGVMITASAAVNDGAGVFISDVVEVTAAITTKVDAHSDTVASAEMTSIGKVRIDPYGDVDASSDIGTLSGVTGDGAGIIVSDTTDIDVTSKLDLAASSDVTANGDLTTAPINEVATYGDVTVDGATSSIAAHTGEGAGAFISDVTEIDVDSYLDLNATTDVTYINAAVVTSEPTVSNDGYGEIEVKGATASGSAITGDGVGVFVNAPTVVVATASIEMSGAGDSVTEAQIDVSAVNESTSNSESVEAEGATASGSAITGDGVGVFVTDVTTIEVAPTLDLNVSFDASYIIAGVVEITSNVTGDGVVIVEAEGANASGSAITGDGVAVIVSNVIDIDATASIEISGAGDSVTEAQIDVSAVNERTSNSEEIVVEGATASGSAITGDGVGVFVTDVTELTSTSYGDMYAELDILEVSAVVDVTSNLTNNGVGVVEAEGATASGSAITGDGVGVFVTDVTDIDVTASIEISGAGDSVTEAQIDVSAVNERTSNSEEIVVEGATASGSAITGDGVGVFVTDVTEVDGTAHGDMYAELDDLEVSAVVDSTSIITVPAYADIDSLGITISGSGIIGDGVAVIVTDVTDIDVTASIESSGAGESTSFASADSDSINEITLTSEEITVEGATASGSAVTGDGAGVVITEGDLITSPITEIVGDTDADYVNNAVVTSFGGVASPASAEIEVNGDIGSVSAVVGDGAGVVVSNVTAISATALLTSNGAAPVDGAAVTTSTAINNVYSISEEIDVYGATASAGSNVGYAVGVLVSDVTTIEVGPTVEQYTLAVIDTIGSTASGSAITGDGVGVFVTDVTDIEASCSVELPSYADVDSAGATGSASGLTAEGVGVFVTDVTTIDAIANVAMPTVAEIDTAGATTTSAGITGDGVGVFVTDTTDIEVTPTVELIGGGIIDTAGATGSASGLTAEGVGVFVTDVTTIDAIANVAMPTVAEIDTAGATTTSAGITGDGVGVFVSDVTTIDVIANVAMPASSDIDSAGATGSSSAITGDGVGVFVSNAINIEATCSVELPSYAAVDSAGATGSVSAITGDGVGIFVSDVTTIDAIATASKPSKSVIDTIGSTASGSAITGDGVGVFVTDVTTIDAIASASKPSSSDIDSAGATGSSSAITGDGVGVFVTDVTTIDAIASASKPSKSVIDTIGSTGSSSAITGDGVGVFVNAPTTIDAIATASKPSSSDIDSAGATGSASGLTADGVGVFVTDVTTIDVLPTIGHVGKSSIDTVGASASGSSITGDGVGVFVTDVTTIDAIASASKPSSGDIDSLSAVGSAAGMTIDAVGIFVTDTTELNVEVTMNFAGVADVEGATTDIDVLPLITRMGTGVVDGVSTNISASGVTSDGAAVIVSDVTEIAAVPHIENYCIGEIVSSSDISTTSYIDANADADRVNGINVFITAPAIVGYGVGVLVSDVTEIAAIPHTINYVESDIEVDGVNGSSSAITGDGVGIVLSNVTDIEVGPTVSSDCYGDITVVGANISNSSNIGYSAGVFLSDVTEVTANGYVEIRVSIPYMSGSASNDATSYVTNNGVVEMDVSSATGSVSAITGDGAGVVISSNNVVDSASSNKATGVADISVPPSSEIGGLDSSSSKPAYGSIAARGASITAGSIVGNGVGVFVSDVTEIAATSTSEAFVAGDVRGFGLATSECLSSIQGSGDITLEGASAAAAADKSHGVGVLAGNAVSIEALGSIEQNGSGVVSGINAIIDSAATNIGHPEVIVDTYSLILAGSGIVGDGSAMAIDVGNMEAVASLSLRMGATVPVNASVEIITWPVIEAIWDISGVDIVGADSTVIEAATGVVVSDSTEVTVNPTIEKMATADVDGLSSSTFESASSGSELTGVSDIYAGADISAASSINNITTAVITGAVNVTVDAHVEDGAIYYDHIMTEDDHYLTDVDGVTEIIAENYISTTHTTTVINETTMGWSDEELS